MKFSVMNLHQEVGKPYSKAQVDKIVHYVGRDQKRFGQLVKIFLTGPYRITQRAARPLSYCVEKHQALVAPHLPALLANLKKPGIHNAVKRNTIRLLQFIDIPKRLHGKVADICFQFLHDKKEPIAVRVFSMTVLGRIAAVNPDLKAELKIMIEDNLPYASAGFRSRAMKVLKDLNRSMNNIL